MVDINEAGVDHVSKFHTLVGQTKNAKRKMADARTDDEQKVAQHHLRSSQKAMERLINPTTGGHLQMVV